MEFRKTILFLLILFAGYLVSGQQSQHPDQDNTIKFRQIKTDSLFDSKQIISLLMIEKSYDRLYRIEFGYTDSLKTTSLFATGENAVAAINGSFFDMDHGGGVAYFERNDSVISRTRDPNIKWGVPDGLLTGAVILSDRNEIVIQPVQTEEFYEMSTKEAAVMVSGPLLIHNSERVKLPDLSFVHRRHPRTCLCNTKESLVFITIDGRSENAAGMNLHEVQEYLETLGCIDAINLDGGGSTTLWIRDKGIVNFPSDRSGERPVANAILVIGKTQ